MTKGNRLLMAANFLACLCVIAPVMGGLYLIAADAGGVRGAVYWETKVGFIGVGWGCILLYFTINGIRERHGGFMGMTICCAVQTVVHFVAIFLLMVWSDRWGWGEVLFVGYTLMLILSVVFNAIAAAKRPARAVVLRAIPVAEKWVGR